MKTMLTRLLAVAIIILAGTVTSCNRDEEGMAHLKVRMMDAPSPFDFDAIYLDILRVEVNVEPEDGESEWIGLTTGAGVYDMLTLVNGTDILLADAEIPAGKVSQVRLILGNGNTIVVNGQSHPLVVPSGQESGLKVNVHEFIGEGEDLTLMLDFDAAHSINAQGNGGYHLKPVMRGVILQRTGTIHGTTVTVFDGGVAVMAEGSVGVYTTYADRSSGEFMLRGLPPGTYVVKVYYPDSDQPVVYTNIVVSANATVELTDTVQ